FNSDGKLDLVTCNLNSNSITLLLNNGAGTFSTTATFTFIPSPWQIVTGDFNSDGKLDIASVGNNGIGSLGAFVLLGNGTGSFGAPVNFATDADPRSICT